MKKITIPTLLCLISGFFLSLKISTSCKAQEEVLISNEKRDPRFAELERFLAKGPSRDQLKEALKKLDQEMNKAGKRPKKVRSLAFDAESYTPPLFGDLTIKLLAKTLSWNDKFKRYLNQNMHKIPVEDQVLALKLIMLSDGERRENGKLQISKWAFWACIADDQDLKRFANEDLVKTLKESIWQEINFHPENLEKDNFRGHAIRVIKNLLMAAITLEKVPVHFNESFFDWVQDLLENPKYAFLARDLSNDDDENLGMRNFMSTVFFTDASRFYQRVKDGRLKVSERFKNFSLAYVYFPQDSMVDINGYFQDKEAAKFPQDTKCGWPLECLDSVNTPKDLEKVRRHRKVLR